MLTKLAGGLLPGIVLYLSMFYKRHELQYRMGIFYSAASLSGAFGGLLASGISQMDGVAGQAGWRWIFIRMSLGTLNRSFSHCLVEGIFTAVFSVCAAFLLPNSLESARFFTDIERSIAVHRFYNDNTTSSMTPFSWKLVKRGILNWNVFFTSITYFCILAPIYSFSLFIPVIIKGLGYREITAQLLTVPPYCAAAIATVIVAYFADRVKRRGQWICMMLPFAIAG